MKITIGHCLIEMNVEENILKLSAPALLVIAGQTSCVCLWDVFMLFMYTYFFILQGKSFLTRDLILNHEQVFSTPIKMVYYCYTNWQINFNELVQKLGNMIEFVPDFHAVTFFKDHGLQDRNENSDPIVIVLDDCMLIIFYGPLECVVF
jgi:hypothetical protein